MRTTNLTIKNKELYKRYQNIKRRCYDKNHVSYFNYGKKGIKMCNEWLGKDGFFNFMVWAKENGYKKELQIDRIDVYGNYSPQNCRWVDRKTNMRNRSNSIKIDGKSLMEIAIELNVKYSTLHRRFMIYGDIRIPKKYAQNVKKNFILIEVIRNFVVRNVKKI